MTLQVVFRRAAKSEFEDAALWYEAENPGLGEEFSFEVYSAIGKAAEQPLLYQVVFADVRSVATRRFPYVIYFRVREQSLVVLAVFHASRNPSVWQGRA